MLILEKGFVGWCLIDYVIGLYVCVILIKVWRG